jgi:hypothetical protein
MGLTIDDCHEKLTQVTQFERQRGLKWSQFTIERNGSISSVSWRGDSRMS